MSAFKTVHLYGHLAEEFGHSFQLAIKTPVQAIKLLEANFRGRFYKAMEKGNYAVVKGETLETGASTSLQELPMGVGTDHIHILPLAEGDKSGGFLALVGIAILSVATYGAYTAFAGAYATAGGFYAGAGATAAGWAAAGSATVLGISTTSLAIFGAALAFGGISQMLSPKLNTGPDTKNKELNFLFNGAVNAVEQGGPVPVVYGRFRVGSVVISGGVEISQGANTDLPSGTDVSNQQWNE